MLSKPSYHELEELLKKVNDVIWKMDLNLTLTYVSPACERIIGFTPRERLSQSLESQMTPASYQKVIALFADELARDKGPGVDPNRSLTIDLEYYHKDGGTLWFENVVGWDRTEDGTIVGIQGVSREITQRKRAENILKESENKFRQIYNNILDVYYEASLDGIITEISPSIEKHSQYKQEDLIGKSLYEIYLNPADRDKLLESLLENGNVKDYEISLTDKDDTQHLCSLNVELIRDEMGNPAKIVGILRDITEHSQAEEQIRKHAENLKVIFDSAPNVLALFNKNVRVEMINRKGASFLGREKRIPSGLLCGDVFNCKHSLQNDGCGTNPECPDCPLRTRILSTFETGQPHVEEEGQMTFLQNGKETIMDILISTSLLDISGNKKVLLSLTDVSKGKDAIRALQESEEKFRLAFHTSPDSINLNRLEDGMYLEINQGFSQFMGYSREEVIGKTYIEINAWKNPDDRKLLVNVLREKGYAENLESEFVGKDGRIRNGLISASVLKMNGEDVIITIIRDITGRKLKERILKAHLNIIEYSNNHSSQDLLQKILDEVENLTESKIGFCHFSEEDLSTRSLHAWSTNTLTNSCKMEEYRRHYAIENAGVWVDCVREGKPVIHNDYASLPHKKGFPAGHVPIIRELVVPSYRGGKLVAILGVGNKPTDYLPIDVETIQQFANLAWETFVRNQSEAALQKSASQHRSILQTAMDGFWLTDKNGKLIEVNETYSQMSGYSIDELLQMEIKDLEFIETEVNISKRIKKIFLVGEDRFESQHRRKDGKVFDVEVSVQYRDDDGGRYIFFLRDITERKQSENAFKSSEQKWRNILVNTPQIGISLDPDANIIFANTHFLKITGWEEHEVIGQNWFDIFIPESIKEDVQEIFRTTMRQQEILGLSSYENQIVIKNGELRDIAWSNALTKDSHGKITDITCLGIDLTERKNWENRLQQAQKMESIGNLAGGIAHDFNNILFPIMGLAEMLTDDLPHGSPERVNAQEILHAGKRGADLVKQILAFSRQHEHKLIPTRIQQVLKEVLKLSRASIPMNIEINQHLQQDCGIVLADSTQLHQIGMNLITNAYHAVENISGKIDVEVREITIKDGLNDLALPPGSYAMLSVADNGVGIQKEYLGKIFDPYFTTKKQGKGTGLGLSVVYGIVKEHKGEIKVISEPGTGTTFQVYLPLMKTSEVAGSISEPMAMETGTERILLVDDEAPIANLVKQMLERLGYSVLMRTSSLDALDSFKASPDFYDLVITDMSMPHMTGEQLAGKMLTVRPDIPIIICTGFSERLTKDTAKAMGLKGFLLKPVIKSAMAKEVRRVLDEGKGHRNK